MAAPRRELPSPGVPGVLAQLTALPPTVRCVAGAVVVAMAVGAVWMAADSLLSWILLAIGALVGVPLLVDGVAARRQAAVDRRERARAELELHELRLALDGVQADKRGVERFLLERGYTSARVRRWIALECGVVLPPVPRWR